MASEKNRVYFLNAIHAHKNVFVGLAHLGTLVTYHVAAQSVHL